MQVGCPKMVPCFHTLFSQLSCCPSKTVSSFLKINGKFPKSENLISNFGNEFSTIAKG